MVKKFCVRSSLLKYFLWVLNSYLPSWKITWVGSPFFITYPPPRYQTFLVKWREQSSSKLYSDNFQVKTSSREPTKIWVSKDCFLDKFKTVTFTHKIIQPLRSSGVSYWFFACSFKERMKWNINSSPSLSLPCNIQPLHHEHAYLRISAEKPQR